MLDHKAFSYSLRRSGLGLESVVEKRFPKLGALTFSFLSKSDCILRFVNEVMFRLLFDCKSVIVNV